MALDLPSRPMTRCCVSGPPRPGSSWPSCTLSPFRAALCCTGTDDIDVSVRISLSDSQAPKRPSSLTFTRTGTHLVVADKFGEVHRYDLSSTAEPEPLLGHMSLVTDVVRPMRPNL